ncbi:unnamed protein product [Penicillium salamii]|uniref:ATP phosphoribosyltransferase n=1 Tax=Penicillium salamii TaxID=1612424 RepID=A0A9W4J1H5_9EURO|nr:unnamed protein product [Penicillium salamii]
MSQVTQRIWTLPRSALRFQRLKAYHTPHLTPSFTTSSPNHSQRRIGLSQPLQDLRPKVFFYPSRKMSTSTIADRYKLVFFVPTENAEPCKEAIFAVGAGSFPGGKYTKCCFQTAGTGQFLPNEGADPAVGAVGALERCEELRIEVMCLGRDVMLRAVEALIAAHPYEEVAYEVYRMENV